MKTPVELHRAPLSSRKIISAGAAAAGILFGAGCADLGERHTPGSFASVRPVFESNCVHCHGPNHLAHMPAFPDTRALANLVGPTKWIVPGHPERSRFFQVVTFADEQPGAMPPTGHVITKSEVGKLRAWIAGGAPVPAGAPVVLVAHGEGPHSH